MKIWTAIWKDCNDSYHTFLFDREPLPLDVVARIVESGEEFEPDREWIEIVGPETICGQAERIMGVMISADQKTEYIEDACCPMPACGSRNIEGQGGGDWDADQVTHGVACLDCGAMWEDEYRLVNVRAQFNAPSCCRCEKQLTVDGKCSDENCPFSYTDQDDERGWAGHPDHDNTKKIP